MIIIKEELIIIIIINFIEYNYIFYHTNYYKSDVNHKEKFILTTTLYSTINIDHYFIDFNDDVFKLYCQFQNLKIEPLIFLN